MHELLTRIHDILDGAVSKQVDSTAYILAHLFDSISQKHHEILALYFPFHNIKDTFHPSEACLYGHIKYIMLQAQ